METKRKALGTGLEQLFNNQNINFEDVEKVIDWVTEQDDCENFPLISGKEIVAVECFPFIPQVRGVDPDTGLICYYITLRITYVNPSKSRHIECLL